MKPKLPKSKILCSSIERRVGSIYTDPQGRKWRIESREERAALSFNDDKSAMQLEPGANGDGKYYCVVMPLRV